MSARGYILISTNVGCTGDVFEKLKGVRNIKILDVITGPYDIIAVLEATDSDSILQLVMNEIRNIPGIEDTLTCLAVPVNPAGSYE